MIEKLNDEILQMKSRIRDYERLLTLRSSIEEELDLKKKEIEGQIDIVEKEARDVERLEKNSVRSLFLAITGKKEEALQKEKEEHLRAKARYQENMEDYSELKENLAEANSMVESYGDVKGYFADLLKEKERILLESGEGEGQLLGKMLLMEDELKVDIREIQEAIEAGEMALGSLGRVEEKLQSAKGWGTWDILGGGLIANIAKHSAIDEANTRAREFQHQLKVFRKELSDVNQFTDVQVNLSSFATFADYFFDGLIADWFVQTKINDSLSNVLKARDSIKEIIGNLQNEKAGLGRRMDENHREIQRILQG